MKDLYLKFYELKLPEITSKKYSATEANIPVSHSESDMA